MYNGIDKRTLKGRKFKGGFSDEVFESYEFQNYVTNSDGETKEYTCGYIGAFNRTVSRDKIVEQALRDTGLGDNGIACWLTSTDGRHLMDDPAKNLKEFKKRVTDYVKGAFENVTVWGHPDHEGTLASTIELRKKIFGEKDNG